MELDKPSQRRGAVAQLGERLNGIQEAVSSILSSSTRKIKGLRLATQALFRCCTTSLRYILQATFTFAPGDA